jgi:putative DNA primase/helicase
LADNVHLLFDGFLAKSLAQEQRTIGPQPSDYADDSLARRFTALHADKLKFVNTWGRWLEWDGIRWNIDETLQVTDRVRTFVADESKAALLGIGSQKLATTVASAKTISAIERLVRADRSHASKPSDWDGDGWLLNTPTGTVDLQTGNLHPHDPKDLITKITAVGPAGGCPQWLAFLHRIFEGDHDLIAYVKRVFGYCLTGSVREHALFFCYGTGGNGKSVLLGAFQNILGEYAVAAPMSTFTASDYDRHPAELAMLRGARLVTAQETEEGERWAEAKIKQLTGGDPISARFMRQDFFTYSPTFKLAIAGNHKPSLRSVDEATRRRFNLIPFTVTLAAAERDPKLSEKLKEEWPGILAWAIEGCLEWQKDGLAAPEAVASATEKYLAEEDVVGRFIAECCDRHATATSEAGQLYERFKRFREKSGEANLSLKSFSQKLESHGLKKRLHPKTRRTQFEGIGLKRDEDTENVWGDN